jgi:uncharacterized membrane protein YbhN (UPF0104 family)
MSRRKKILLIILKLLITAGFFYWAYSGVDQSLWSTIRRASPYWVAAGLLFGLLSQVLSALRWYVILKASSVHVGLKDFIRAQLIGSYFMIVSMAGIGCDVARTMVLARVYPDKTMAIGASVLLDRLIGITAMSLSYFLFLFLQTAHIPADAGVEYQELLRYGNIFFTGSLVFVIVCFIFALPSMYPFMKNVRGRMKSLVIIPETINQCRKNAMLGFLALAVAILLVMVHFACFACAVESILPQCNWGSIFAAMPVIDSLCSMPLSVAGVGIREKLFQIYFGAEIGQSEALLAASVGFFFSMIWSLAGGVQFLLGKSTMSALEEQNALPEQPKKEIVGS